MNDPLIQKTDIKAVLCISEKEELLFSNNINNKYKEELDGDTDNLVLNIDSNEINELENCIPLISHSSFDTQAKHNNQLISKILNITLYKANFGSSISSKPSIIGDPHRQKEFDTNIKDKVINSKSDMNHNLEHIFSKTAIDGEILRKLDRISIGKWLSIFRYLIRNDIKTIAVSCKFFLIIAKSTIVKSELSPQTEIIHEDVFYKPTENKPILTNLKSDFFIHDKQTSFDFKKKHFNNKNEKCASASKAKLKNPSKDNTFLQHRFYQNRGTLFQLNDRNLEYTGCSLSNNILTTKHQDLLFNEKSNNCNMNAPKDKIDRTKVVRIKDHM